MSETVDVTTEPVTWPIAPDGYVPNSVIRSLRRKGRGLGQTDCWDDINLYSLHQDTEEDEDVSARVFWLFEDDEDEEEEITFDVKRRKKDEEEDDKRDVKGKEDKKTETVRKKQTEVEGKDVTDRRHVLKPSHDFQTKTHLNHDDGKVKPPRQEASSTRTVNFLPTSSHEPTPAPLRDLREHMKLPEAVTPPLQHPSNTQRTSTFIPQVRPKPPVVSADPPIPKQGPRQSSFTTAEPSFTRCLPTTEPQNWTSHPQKSAPSIPEDPQPQPDPSPPEPIRDKRFLLSSDKYRNISDQETVTFDRKILEFYKKLKLSRCGKVSSPAQRFPVSRATQRGRSLNGGLSSSSAFGTKSSTIQTSPSRPLCPDPARFAQGVTSIEDQGSHERATTKPLGKPSNARQLTSVQLGQGAAHHRVVQSIQMKDTQELASSSSSSHFHHVIPMASQHSFFTLDPCGKTRYGRLQFDWMRLI
ncbi:proton channel OtopLc-like [Seriola aureovittata]|uniref:proton channel OtopLc-like n=1 Tax=Seriola aureovittata TaxID=2871759 RepID=UPI0024BEA9B0|nr:proton channel OtopLc-like [Seriola aureovittata]XP_056230418.1 proton channel OtopLc-like [Seriola aureovittata]